MKYLLPIIAIAMLNSCQTKERIDLLIKEATTYTVDEDFSKAEAIAIRDGKFIAVGTSNELEAKYNPDSTISLKGKFIYPGWFDPHSHFTGYGETLSKVDVTECTSIEEVIERCRTFADQYNPAWITGRGWDQNDWGDKTFPDKEILDKHFPDIPVLLRRVDGHAGWANSKALEIAGINADTKIDGGDVLLKNGEPTGILIDNAADLVLNIIPKPGREEMVKSIKMAEKNCFAVGLTSVTDAGLESSTVQIIDSLQKAGVIKMRVNAWLSPTEENFRTYIDKGPVHNDYLTIGTLKLYADGALGSRGARLIDDYADDPGNKGLIVTSEEELTALCRRALKHDFQVATHAIGDGANRLVLKIYASMLKEGNDKRWRIEHAQVIHPNDFQLFGKYNIIPSIQSTHATSDMYWAEDRLGPDRMLGAYSYKTLLGQNGWLPNGSDFPVESINPLYGFFAAVARKDQSGFPENGFRPEEALSREEALKAMTIWAAKAAFEESYKGSIEAGKLADFVVTEKDIMTMDLMDIPRLKVYATYSAGEEVYKNDSSGR